MKPNETRIADLWCRLMHAAPMWPAHGQYECRTCGRRYPVWDQPFPAAPRAMDEARARRAMATAN